MTRGLVSMVSVAYANIRLLVLIKVRSARGPSTLTLPISTVLTKTC